jgi:two-component system chemotaxis response regulator CheB
MASILSDLSTTDRTPPHFEVQAITKTVSEITCPDCGGTLWEEQKGTLVDYRCRVGHAYSTLGVADHHQDAQETALWAAAVALEEGAAIDERLAAQLGSSYKANAQKNETRRAY